MITPPISKRKRPVTQNGLFRLEIDRKTNVISLVAFLLSVAGIASQLYFFFQGPQVSLQDPDGVVFYGENVRDNKTYLYLASRMTYVNTGQPGFNDAIKRETATLNIGNKSINFEWKDFLASEGKGESFLKNRQGDAIPRVVGAGSVETHETSFSPVTINKLEGKVDGNFVLFNDFVILARAEKEITVLFAFETFKGTKKSVRCVIPVNDRFIFYLQKGWSARGCIPL